MMIFVYIYIYVAKEYSRSLYTVCIPFYTIGSESILMAPIISFSVLSILVHADVIEVAIFHLNGVKMVHRFITWAI